MRMKKTAPASFWSSELMSLLIIALAFLLCFAVGVLGRLEDRAHVVEAAHAAAQTAAQVQPMAPYEQLSDPLLVLVNDRAPLPEDWSITPYLVNDEIVDLRMAQDYTAMEEAAAKEDVWFWVASGYRSVEEQQKVLEREIEKYEARGMTREEGEKEALRTIARPGCSEHHTGLAIDLNEVSDAFEETAAYRWLSLHAAEYGFVQRYRESKAEITGIDRESWHYRYVGRKYAQEMEKLDLCLEEYVEYLKKLGKR